MEVTAAEALELASVIDGDEFVLVRSTGRGTDASAADDQQTSPSSVPTAAASAAASVPATPGRAADGGPGGAAGWGGAVERATGGVG